MGQLCFILAKDCFLTDWIRKCNVGECGTENRWLEYYTYMGVEAANRGGSVLVAVGGNLVKQFRAHARRDVCCHRKAVPSTKASIRSLLVLGRSNVQIPKSLQAEYQRKVEAST
jgi:hypothetical protein